MIYISLYFFLSVFLYRSLTYFNSLLYDVERETLFKKFRVIRTVLYIRSTVY
jgi:hypothetical protein